MPLHAPKHVERGLRFEVLGESALEYLADSRIPESPDLVFLRHFSKQTKRYEGGAMKFVDELWTRWTRCRPALREPLPVPLPSRHAVLFLLAMQRKTSMRRKG